MRFWPCFVLPLLFAGNAHALEWKPELNGDFALKFAQSPDGFWVGTEDKGLWHRQLNGEWENVPLPTGKTGTEIPAVTALAARGDQLWIGTGRDGLIVLDHDGNQKIQFKSFPVPDPHVNDIEVSENGEVWVATDWGVIAYDETKKWHGSWIGLDRINEQIMAVAVKGQTVVLATACDGLRISRNDGISYERIKGPQYQPDTPTGDGLPSPVINDVCFDSLGNIWVATDFGIARSEDEGKTWSFLRGADWKPNVEGSALGFKSKPVALRLDPCGEDWVQCLRPTSDGKMWLGFRQKGAELRDAASGEQLYATWDDIKTRANDATCFVRDIFPLQNGRALLALYGGGGILPILGGDFPALHAGDQKVTNYPLPDDLEPLSKASMLNLPFEPALFEGIDRQTRGDWVGKYGAQLTEIFYVDSELKREAGYTSSTTTGPHRAGPDADCYVYIHWLSTENPDVLLAPTLKTRRQAEINDGTWNNGRYPYSFDGPGLWTKFELPEGTHRVSLYWFNKDGHSDDNRYRDHIVRLKQVTHEPDDAQEDKEVAKCRLHDGWNGQYANFLVKGPGKFRFEIERHRSHATILQGFFVEKIAP